MMLYNSVLCKPPFLFSGVFFLVWFQFTAGKTHGDFKTKETYETKKNVQLISAEQTELLTVDKNTSIPFKFVFKTRLLPSIPTKPNKDNASFF